MRTGLAYNNDEDNEGLMVDEPESSIRYFLKGELDYEPGTRFHYSDAPPHLVGAVIQKRTGKTLDQFADEVLFGPLGITDYLWEKHRDGLCYGAFGLYMKPRDMAKIGQLCLQEGKWQGQQIVSADWLREATSIQTNRNSGPYGYYWWIRPDYNAYTMAGHGGNFIYIVPEKQMVIVFTANPFVDGSIAIQTEEFENLVHQLIESAH
jgi:CubicO group peptidase (beta-lactamase class C family)